MRSISYSTAIAAFAALAFSGGARAASGTICLYLNNQGSPDPSCSDYHLFGCYNGADVWDQCIALSPDGIYSYSITGTSDDDDQNCATFNPVHDSVADMWYLYDDTDCSADGATYVWSSCSDVACADISEYPAYNMYYTLATGTTL